jgi:cell volume regulation protein A
VHDQITFFVKAFFFTFVGAMLGPPWGPIVLGTMLGVLLLVARVPAVALSLVGSKLSLPAKGVVAVSLPRGMAAGVLAMLPAQAGMKLTDSLSVVVFSCLVTTILLFAVGFPVLKAQLSRIDPSAFAPDAALSSMGDTAPPPPSAPPENPS